MINAALKKKIVTTLGKQYSGKIIEHLNKHGVYNQKGEPYSASSIQNIVGGRKNETVESHILNLLASEQKRLKLLKIKKSKIIKNK
ncbi:hypothetical protein [Flavobacterium alkalisoli]|uniref:hypothetical protein n=1 Tax=Flavobacterium alkalisoli TaxID=2602769 RepID=UPI003A8F7055